MGCNPLNILHHLIRAEKYPAVYPLMDIPNLNSRLIPSGYKGIIDMTGPKGSRFFKVSVN
jgi:hypothetical protein